MCHESEDDATMNGFIGRIAGWADIRNSLLLLLTLIVVLMLYGPLNDLISSPAGEYYSHIVLIPIVSLSLLFRRRKAIIGQREYRVSPGVYLLAAGILLFLSGIWFSGRLSQTDYACLTALGGVGVWSGGFSLLYGPRALRTARFPLLFLLFMVPVPGFLMDPVISVLRAGSTETTELLFKIVGLAYVREGFVFHLPNMGIEIAKECSGIRSTIGLVISSVLAGYLFLNRGWSKLALVLAILPITIFKNAIRITTLSLLAVYVNARFITESWLHHSGGIVFYVPALGIMGFVLICLRKVERKAG